MWKNVRKMRSRERQFEIMDWTKRINCDVCAFNVTGLTGEEYMEVSDMVIHGLMQRVGNSGQNGGLRGRFHH